MPKVLQINECLNFSTGKIAQSIGEKVIENGWDSWIAYSSRQPYVNCKSNVLKIGAFINPYIHYLEHRIFDREGLSSRFATKQLISKIKKIQPDIIHLHNIHDHWLNYKILFEYLNQTDIKVVWTFHDCWAFTGHCFHFVTKNCDRWKTECYDCPLQHEYPKTLVDCSRKNFKLKKSLFGGSKNLSIVACSEWIGSLVRESFLKDKYLQIIHNGVDLNIFKPSGKKMSFLDGKYRIIAVSNIWNKEKGIQDIFKLRDLLSDDFLITIVGISANQVKTLPKGVFGIQRTQNVQELVDLYSSSDVLINPTYADTFPTTNIEALACGTPVITYDTGGSPGAIDSNTGIVVGKGDVSGLAEAVKYIINNPEKFTTENCRNRAVEHFNKDVQFNKYIDLYEDLLRSSRCNS